MNRSHPVRYAAAFAVGFALLMCGPAIAGEGDRGSRDRQTTEWTLPAQSMRDVARERAADRKPADESPASSRVIEPPHPDECVKC